MDLVHRRRGNEPAQPAINRFRKSDVGVMKLHHRIEAYLVKNKFPQTNPKEGNQEYPEKGGDKYFAKMETIGGGYIHARIGVVHAMKSPEKRDLVIHPMPP